MTDKTTPCALNFSFIDLLEHMEKKGAQVGHREQLTIATDIQRIKLVVSVTAIDDISPKLHLVARKK